MYTIDSLHRLIIDQETGIVNSKELSAYKELSEFYAQVLLKLILSSRINQLHITRRFSSFVV